MLDGEVVVMVVVEEEAGKVPVGLSVLAGTSPTCHLLFASDTSIRRQGGKKVACDRMRHIKWLTPRPGAKIVTCQFQVAIGLFAITGFCPDDIVGYKL